MHTTANANYHTKEPGQQAYYIDAGAKMLCFYARPQACCG